MNLDMNGLIGWDKNLAIKRNVAGNSFSDSDCRTHGSGRDVKWSLSVDC